VVGGCLVDDGEINIKTSSNRVILQCEPHSGGGCKERWTRQDWQQDRQEHQGVDRGHLDKDGYINIKTSISTETKSCCVNSIWAAAATTQVTTSSRGQSWQSNRQVQSGVVRGCRRGDGDVPWTTSTTLTSLKLQRVSPSEGCCEVSGKWKWKETLTFNGRVNRAWAATALTTTLKYLPPRDTLTEGRGKVSGIEGDFFKTFLDTLTVQCSVNRDWAATASTKTSKCLQCVTLNEGRSEVSGMVKKKDRGKL
jgi:hypothetical protein